MSETINEIVRLRIENEKLKSLIDQKSRSLAELCTVVLLKELEQYKNDETMDVEKKTR